MIRRIYLGKVLLFFGFITLLISLIDLTFALFPLHIANAQWVFAVTQEVSERSIIPIIAIISILAGFFFIEIDKNKFALTIEKLISVFSVVYSVGLVVLLLFFTLSMKNVELQYILTLKNNNEAIKEQILSAYSSKVPATYNNVSNDEKNKTLESNLIKLEKKILIEVEQTKKKLLKVNIKTIFSLLLQIILYLVVGIMGFQFSSSSINKLRFSKR